MRYPSIEQLLAAISFTQSDLSLFSFLHLDIDSLRGIQILEIAMLIFVEKLVDRCCSPKWPERTAV